jgi:hypothetical protein
MKINHKHEFIEAGGKCVRCGESSITKTKAMKKKFKKGQIVYSQGIWKCKVVDDYDVSIAYIPLEGYAPHQKGQTAIANKNLFTIKREKGYSLPKDFERNLEEAMEEMECWSVDNHLEKCQKHYKLSQIYAKGWNDSIKVNKHQNSELQREIQDL